MDKPFGGALRATSRPGRKHFFIGERLRGAPFGSLAPAFVLIDGAGSDEIARFPFNPKTAIRSLGERLAHLRLRGNLYLAERLLKSYL